MNKYQLTWARLLMDVIHEARAKAQEARKGFVVNNDLDEVIMLLNIAFDNMGSLLGVLEDENASVLNILADNSSNNN